MNEHESVIFYTLDDNGIWIRCICGEWEKHIGQFPAIEDLSKAWAEHQPEARK